MSVSLIDGHIDNDVQMTDEQIIKALECHADTDIATCKICAYDGVVRCGHQLCYDTLDLIHRKNAEIERLQKAKFGVDLSISSIKAEAVREFAERLKEESFNGMYIVIPEEVVFIDDIDNLVKEMVGEG